MNSVVPVTSEFQEDVRFYQKLMPLYNGVSLLVQCADKLEVDLCLRGCGGVCGS